MPDAHYERPELAALYDLECVWSSDREFYRQLGGATPKHVLEVGSGTGLISRAMAGDGHFVTAVDPARAMLDFGSHAPGGEKVTWIEAFAQDFRIDRRFDLAFMTGHAFQVLLADADILAALANIFDNLQPGGHFAFETRNPALPWETIFEDSMTLDAPEGPVRVDWRVEWRKGEYIRFGTHYQLADGEWVSISTLRFASMERVQTMLRQTGFEIVAVHGNWDRTPFDPALSKEIIFLAQKPA